MEIKIRGTRDTDLKIELKEAANFYASKLFSKRLSKNIYLEIYLKRDLDVLGYCSFTNLDDPRPRDFEIELLNKVPLNELLQTLAHEMVHVKQYAKGELKDVNGSGVRFRWAKKVYEDAEYTEQPWEIEAFAKEVELYREYKRYSHDRRSQRSDT